jgi:hypothetical protein
MNWETKKTIRSEIASRLKAGESKEAVFRDIRNQYGDGVFIKRVLSEMPSLQARNKYSVTNRALFMFLGGIALNQAVFLVMGFYGRANSSIPWSLLPIVIQLLLMKMVFGFSRLSYLAVAIYGGIQLFDYGRGIASTDLLIKTLCTIMMMFWAISIALSMYLYVKLKESKVALGN